MLEDADVLRAVSKASCAALSFFSASAVLFVAAMKPVQGGFGQVGFALGEFEFRFGGRSQGGLCERVGQGVRGDESHRVRFPCGAKHRRTQLGRSERGFSRGQLRPGAFEW